MNVRRFWLGAGMTTPREMFTVSMLGDRGRIRVEYVGVPEPTPVARLRATIAEDVRVGGRVKEQARIRGVVREVDFE